MPNSRRQEALVATPDRRVLSEPSPVRHGPVGFYDGDDFLASAAVAFLLPALLEGALAVAVLTVPHQRAVERELDAAGVDVDAARQRGDYLPVDSDRLATELVIDGEVDGERFEAATSSLVAAAAARSGEMRICGDLATVLWDAGERQAVLELERRWDAVGKPGSLQLLCMYSNATLDRTPMDVFERVCAGHSQIGPVESYASLVAPDAARTRALQAVRERGKPARAEDLARWGHALEQQLDAARHEAEDQRFHFQRAIAGRDVIGQAKGILMADRRVDADTAFALLREASSRSHRKVHDVARALVEQQLRRH